MAQKRKNADQIELLNWEPPQIVKRYDEERVRTHSLNHKISRAIAETLSETELERADVARRMSEFLGEEVSRNMLNAYASPAREDHNISYVRLLALMHATNDVRLLQIGAEMFGHVVAENKYLDWIKLGMEADRRDQAQRVASEVDQEFNLALKAVRRRSS